MAKKTSANQGSSGEPERGTPSVSRKVIGQPSAPYERKAGVDSGDEKKPGRDGEQAADQSAQPDDKSGDKPDNKTDGKPDNKFDGKAATDPGSAEAAADQRKSEAAKDSARKDTPARRDVRASDQDEPAPPAAAAEAAPAAEQPKAAPADAEPVSAASDEPPPLPEVDPAAEVEVLLKPREIQPWDPATPAAPPLKAPAGDSRSFRRVEDGAEEFVLIYRVSTVLIRRAGRVGVMGTWTVTEYPHIGSAAHAYAQQCSDLTHAGFRDLR